MKLQLNCIIINKYMYNNSFNFNKKAGHYDFFNLMTNTHRSRKFRFEVANRVCLRKEMLTKKRGVR